MTDWLPDQPRYKTAKSRASARGRVRSNGLAEARSEYRSGKVGAHRPQACPPSKEAKRDRARERGYIQIFLSHKSRDHKAAEELRKVLQAYGGPMLRVFTYDDIEKGDDFRDEISRQLYESDWFMLLFTGVDDRDWSWCHHEAGTFCGMMYPDADRVVVFYPSNVALPDPLERYQAVRCQEGEPDDVYRFFEDLFGKEPYPGMPPIHPFFANDRDASSIRETAADRIIRAVGRLVVESIEPKEVMIIHVRNKAALLEGSEFPADTCIRRSGALQLFEVGEREFSWQQFQDALEPNFRRCLNQSFWPAVYQACAKSVRSHKLASTHTVLQSPATRRHYMPMLSRVETTGDNSATFRLTFVHVAAGTQAEVRHKSVARVFTALNLAHRFRWEIIDPYRDLKRLQERVRSHHQAMDSDSVDGGSALSTVWEAIRLLEVESENRGVYDPQALPADFGPGADARVREMFALWGQYRERLKRAASDDDAATFSQILREFDPINVEFISLASQRLGELVRADARHH
jgi:TIR domain